MRCKVAVAILHRMDAGDMERLRCFLLQFVVFDGRIVGGENLGHGVGEILNAIDAGVMFDNGCLRTLFRHDQVARVDRGVCVSRQEQQVDRRLDHGIAL